MASLKNVVSAAWLAENFTRPDVRLLDGSWFPPGSSAPKDNISIPGACFFDIDEIANKDAPFPHTLPSSKTFETAVSKLGIRNDDPIIVYDQHGIFSSPRVWWTFKMFGHEKVSILDGGLPAWLKGQYPTEPGFINSYSHSNYVARSPLSKVISCGEISARLADSPQIIDARSEARFYGREPEARAGLRSGHIPGSFSLHYAKLLRADKRLLEFGDIAEEFGLQGVDLSKPIITSCGSGITAAILALCLDALGAKDVSVYDGSWAEWGGSSLPISLGE